MVITLGPELEATLKEVARHRGRCPRGVSAQCPTRAFPEHCLVATAAG